MIPAISLTALGGIGLYNNLYGRYNTLKTHAHNMEVRENIRKRMNEHRERLDSINKNGFDKAANTEKWINDLGFTESSFNLDDKVSRTNLNRICIDDVLELYNKIIPNPLQLNSLGCYNSLKSDWILLTDNPFKYVEIEFNLEYYTMKPHIVKDIDLVN